MAKLSRLASPCLLSLRFLLCRAQMQNHRISLTASCFPLPLRALVRVIGLRHMERLSLELEWRGRAVSIFSLGEFVTLWDLERILEGIPPLLTWVPACR